MAAGDPRPSAAAGVDSAQRLFVRAAASSGGPSSAPSGGGASTDDARAAGCPVASSSSSSSSQPPSSCPVSSPTGAAADADAAHAARINMPTVPNVAAGAEAARLSTQRERSSIPMAPTGEAPAHQKDAEPGGVWVYPSEQQFYNAMKRKGWDPAAPDMASVVAIHNGVNERAWQHVLAWEALHACECAAGPRLKRFQGRPDAVSPKARLLNLMGYKLPFDRHDWVVDRCGVEVRYVIDFYSGAPPPRPPLPPAAGAAAPTAPTAAPATDDRASLFLDVRPALDSVGALWDRLRVQFDFVGSGRWLK